MQIPFEVKPRPDTGLWNAKIGIWLFLASEVMLFGGLFSGYVFLRMGAEAVPDYFWPQGELHVLPGAINTAVLIASSVFVVYAWVQLKLRNYRQYQFWMFLVVLCALGFLGIKAYEYYGKFTHYSVRLKDESVVQGHDLSDLQKFENVSKVTVNLDKADLAFIDYVPDEQIGDLKFTPLLDAEITQQKDALAALRKDPASAENGETREAKKLKETVEDAIPELEKAIADLEATAAAGAIPLNKGTLGKVRETINEGREVLHDVSMAKNALANIATRAANEKAKQDWLANTDPQKERFKPATLQPVFAWDEAAGVSSIEFQPSKPFSVEVKRAKLRTPGNERIIFRDYTALDGVLAEESRYLVVGELDKLDLRSFEDPSQSRIFEYIADKSGLKHEEGEKGGAAPEGGDHHATTSAAILEEFLKHGEEATAEAEEHGWKPELRETRMMDLHHVPLRVPWEEVKFYSNFAPKLNTYYAIYFSLTGLHGLHVLIGASVLAYFLFFGKKLYDKDPEHMANRVEVGGLFWHFVDLVWIFLFPLLYLL